MPIVQLAEIPINPTEPNGLRVKAVLRVDQPQSLIFTLHADAGFGAPQGQPFDFPLSPTEAATIVQMLAVSRIGTGQR